ncbi:MAG: hypothetical protein KH347_03175 [Acetobacter sp.]|nr:hypothetical protein [Acetobacter sp.]
MHWYQMKLLGRAQTHSSDSQVCMSELLESLRSKPVPVPVRIGTKDYRAKSTCKQLHPLDVKAITAKLAFTKE